MSDIFLSKGSTRERIDPAEADLQRELIDEIGKLESATADVKFQALTVGAAATTVTPAAHGCSKVRYWTASTTVSIGNKDSQPVLLVQNIWNELSINNVGSLRFNGSAGGEVIYVTSN